MAGFETQKQRYDFILFWADYVKMHSDIEWSKQQNILINSALQAAKQMSKEEYLEWKLMTKRKI